MPLSGRDLVASFDEIFDCYLNEYDMTLVLFAYCQVDAK